MVGGSDVWPALLQLCPGSWTLSTALDDEWDGPPTEPGDAALPAVRPLYKAAGAGCGIASTACPIGGAPGATRLGSEQRNGYAVVLVAPPAMAPIASPMQLCSAIMTPMPLSRRSRGWWAATCGGWMRLWKQPSTAASLQLQRPPGRPAQLSRPSSRCGSCSVEALVSLNTTKYTSQVFE